MPFACHTETRTIYGFLVTAFALLLMAISSARAEASETGSVIDDFSDSHNNSLGVARQFFNDTMVGGATHIDNAVENGAIRLKGEIVPPRGQLGWASTLLLLNPQGLPQDASQFDGIRLLVKVNQGNLSVSANSTEITNFDYHAAPIAVRADGQFHEVKIPFVTMKRAWSEQTELNTATINSLSIVSYGFEKTPFDMQVDEVSFY